VSGLANNNVNSVMELRDGFQKKVCPFDGVFNFINMNKFYQNEE
jgi:hypothetical protein